MEQSYIILFDGECNMCNSTVQFVLKNDKKNIFKFASLQSGFGKKFLAERNLPLEFNSIVLYKPKEAYYIKSTAALKILKELGLPYSLLYIFIIIPSPIRNIFYNVIARNRYRWFGKSEECMVPTPEIRNRFID